MCVYLVSRYLQYLLPVASGATGQLSPGAGWAEAAACGLSLSPCHYKLYCVVLLSSSESFGFLLTTYFLFCVAKYLAKLFIWHGARYGTMKIPCLIKLNILKDWKINIQFTFWLKMNLGPKASNNFGSIYLAASRSVTILSQQKHSDVNKKIKSWNFFLLTRY